MVFEKRKKKNTSLLLSILWVALLGPRCHHSPHPFPHVFRPLGYGAGYRGGCGRQGGGTITGVKGMEGHYHGMTLPVAEPRDARQEM